MSDVSDIIGYVGGGLGGAAGVGVIAKYIWDTVRTRRDTLEAKAESERDAKMSAILEKLNVLELDMRSLLEKHATSLGQVAEVKARIEGISTNHGGRLGTLEQSFVEVRTRIVALEAAIANHRKR